MDCQCQCFSFLKHFVFIFMVSCSLVVYVRTVAVTGTCTRQMTSVIGTQPTSRFRGQRKLFAGPHRCRKFIFTSCSYLSTSSTTPVHHFSSYLHARYSLMRTDSVVMLSESGSPMNVERTRKFVIFCYSFILHNVGTNGFEEMVTLCSWYGLSRSKSFLQLHSNVFHSFF